MKKPTKNQNEHPYFQTQGPSNDSQTLIHKQTLVHPQATEKKRHQNIGDQAELAAQRLLLHHGLSILHRNFECKLGEIDIIAKENNTVIFLEVRYRKYNSYGSGAATVTRKKQKKIINTAAFYLQKFRLDVECRFDVIELHAKPQDKSTPSTSAFPLEKQSPLQIFYAKLRSRIDGTDTHSKLANSAFNDPQFTLHWIKNAFM